MKLDEHNTLPKPTRRHIKLDKFIFGTPWLPDLLCDIGLHHQYGISVAESQTFLLAKRPQRRRARRNGSFRRLVISRDRKFSTYEKKKKSTMNDPYRPPYLAARGLLFPSRRKMSRKTSGTRVILPLVSRWEVMKLTNFLHNNNNFVGFVHLIAGSDLWCDAV